MNTKMLAERLDKIAPPAPVAPVTVAGPSSELLASIRDYVEGRPLSRPPRRSLAVHAAMLGNLAGNYAGGRP